MHCNDILRRPITLMPCDDSFCFACIMPSFEGKSDIESKCPLCHQNISLENIHASTKLQKMLDSLLDSLTLECLKSCGQVFKLDEKHIKLEHEKVCGDTTYHSTQVNQFKFRNNII